jgi:hypothetical protein
MPVLPLVASMTRPPGGSRPSASAASIMDSPARSLTLAAGLKNSSLAKTVASRPAAKRLIRTRGVRPTSSVASR